MNAVLAMCVRPVHKYVVSSFINLKRREMKLILLIGKPTTGKTTTLNLLYDTLYPQHANIVVGKTKVGGCKDDFECILEWTGKGKTLKIGIFTMGDYYRTCIRVAQKYSCKVDVLVLAYSDKFRSGHQKILAQYTCNFVVNKTLASAPRTKLQCNQQDVIGIISAF
jgi:ABC-type branched-subunit amino acid transport system ATPase component